MFIVILIIIHLITSDINWYFSRKTIFISLKNVSSDSLVSTVLLSFININLVWFLNPIIKCNPFMILYITSWRLSIIYHLCQNPQFVITGLGHDVHSTSEELFYPDSPSNASWSILKKKNGRYNDVNIPVDSTLM